MWMWHTFYGTPKHFDDWMFDINSVPSWVTYNVEGLLQASILDILFIRWRNQRRICSNHIGKTTFLYIIKKNILSRNWTYKAVWCTFRQSLIPLLSVPDLLNYNKIESKRNKDPYNKFNTKKNKIRINLNKKGKGINISTRSSLRIPTRGNIAPEFRSTCMAKGKKRESQILRLRPRANDRWMRGRRSTCSVLRNVEYISEILIYNGWQCVIFGLFLLDFTFVE